LNHDSQKGHCLKTHPECREDEETGECIEYFVRNIFTAPTCVYEREIKLIGDEWPGYEIRVGLTAYQNDKEIQGMRPVFVNIKKITIKQN